MYIVVFTVRYIFYEELKLLLWSDIRNLVELRCYDHSLTTVIKWSYLRASLIIEVEFKLNQCDYSGLSKNAFISAVIKLSGGSYYRVV